jgi:glycosyltransferase involved in cell wall biosynthesis
MPLVTVFMAAYNASKFIEKSIKSILCQTFKDYELIIVDDGSTDNTLDIIRSFTDERITIIENKINRGLIYTRNLALEHAKGTYLAIQDSDDISFPDRLEKQVITLDQNENLALIGSKALKIDKDNNVLNTKLDVISGSDLLKTQLFFENTFVHSSIMIRTSVFNEINGYQTYPSAEDYDLFIRISEKYAIDNLNDYLVYYRVHNNNFSTVNKDLLNKQIYIIKENQLKKLLIYNTKDFFCTTIFDKYNYKRYTNNYHELIKANDRLKIYDKETFNFLIFKNWLDHITQSNLKYKLRIVLFSPLTKLSYLKKRVVKQILN